MICTNYFIPSSINPITRFTWPANALKNGSQTTNHALALAPLLSNPTVHVTGTLPLVLAIKHLRRLPTLLNNLLAVKTTGPSARRARGRKLHPVLAHLPHLVVLAGSPHNPHLPAVNQPDPAARPLGLPLVFNSPTPPVRVLHNRHNRFPLLLPKIHYHHRRSTLLVYQLPLPRPIIILQHLILILTHRLYRASSPPPAMNLIHLNLMHLYPAVTTLIHRCSKAPRPRPTPLASCYPWPTTSTPIIWTSRTLS